MPCRVSGPTQLDVRQALQRQQGSRTIAVRCTLAPMLCWLGLDQKLLLQGGTAAGLA